MGTMARDKVETGETDPGFARNAPQTNFLDVAKIRAEPLVTVPVPRMPSTMNEAELVVPKIAVAPGASLIAVSAAVLIAAPRPRHLATEGRRACVIDSTFRIF